MNFLDALTGRLGTGRQVAILSVGVIVAALVFGVSQWATRPTMVPLFSDVPVESMKAMTDKLTESGIAYELDATGTTVLVASSDVARARVDLASSVMPAGNQPGLELFDQATWGMTDFTQRVNYRRALEGELERTIGKMKDIKAVQVHLAIEDDQLFRESNRPSKASVTLTMASGNRPGDEMVRGIATLVAGSIGGLEPERVAVIDERGNALTMDDQGSVAGLSSRQLAVQQEVEHYMETKATSLLSSLVGAGNAKVQVAATINFDKVERTVQAVDPERQALASEQKAEVTPSTPQQGAGYSTSATSYENTKSVETFSGAIGNVRKLTVAVLVADKVTQPAADSGAAAPPAPVITTRTPEELARIESLIRNALGVDSIRGDMISVVSAPFDLPAPVAVMDSVVAPQDLLGKIQANPKPVVALAALVVLLIVAVVLILALKGKKQPALPATAQPEALTAGQTPGYAELPAGAQFQGDAADGAALEQQALLDERRPIVLPPPPTTPEREQAMATVDQRPDAAVRVVRNWLRQ